MSDDRLLIPATRALLDGWCGPVEYECALGWLPGVWDHGLGCVLTERGPQEVSCACHRWALEAHVRLDASRAEVRDRVVRVVAETLADPARDIVAPQFEPQQDPDVREPVYLAEWVILWGSTLVRWFVARRAADDGNAVVELPALAALDPNDDTRLPDRSRLVDALALVAVAREVLRG